MGTPPPPLRHADVLNGLSLYSTIWGHYVQFQSKPSLKIAPSRGHLLVKKRTILAIWLRSYFFRNKTFLVFKIESWNVKHLFHLGFRETSENYTSFRQYSENVYLLGLKIVLTSWNLWGFPNHSYPNSLQITRDMKNATSKLILLCCKATLPADLFGVIGRVTSMMMPRPVSAEF